MTTLFNDNETILGRGEINDIDAILAIPMHDPNEVEHVVKNNADTHLHLGLLARPARRCASCTRRPRSASGTAPPTCRGTPTSTSRRSSPPTRRSSAPASTPAVYIGTPVEKWGDKEWLEFGIEGRNWMLSQFLHGEQGALICTAKIVETVPWYDAKLYASTQVMDEARHVEVFARYLSEKLGGQYQVNSHLRMLLDDIVNDSRWDMTYLGMQVMVEGLALAAFGFLHQITSEPLLKQLLRYVMSDEARHVAFGVLSLKEVYDGMSDAEIKDRQEFAFEAAIRMRDRFMQQEVWERMGVDMRDVDAAGARRPDPRHVPADAVLQDRAELQEARPARPQRQVAAPPVRGDGRHPVRGLGGHRRGVQRVRARQPRPASRRRRVTQSADLADFALDAACSTSTIQVCHADWNPAQYRHASPPNGRSRSTTCSALIEPGRMRRGRRSRLRTG